MKYKRTKKTSKHSPDTTPSISPTKATLKRRTAVSIILVAIVFLLTRVAVIDKTAIIDFVSGKPPSQSPNMFSFVEMLGRKIPFIEDIGQKGAQFCFEYLRGFESGEGDVRADKTDADITPDASVTPIATANQLPTSIEESPADTVPTFAPVVPCPGEISSPFGKRRHPVGGESSFHNGIDIAAPSGAEVFAIEDGVVESACYNQFSGNLVVIRHTTEYTSSYAHLASSCVAEGDYVTQGQQIGIVGSTGIATGPHLHMEIRQNGEPVDPMSLFAGDEPS